MLNNMTAYALLSMDFIFHEARRYYQRTVLESSFSYLLPFYRFGDLSDHHFVNV